MCKEKHMYNHYPEQTKHNVVAVYRAGVRASTISRTLSIPRSTIMTWIESKEYMDVLPADETILGHFNTNTLLPAKAEKKDLWIKNKERPMASLLQVCFLSQVC